MPLTGSHDLGRFVRWLRIQLARIRNTLRRNP